jgi:hypothetical protein
VSVWPSCKAGLTIARITKKTGLERAGLYYDAESEVSSVSSES